MLLQYITPRSEYVRVEQELNEIVVGISKVE
jgi:hypothetical protein